MSSVRRLHVDVVRSGLIALEPAQARHAREVLRLAEGAAVEVFDDAGGVAPGVLIHAGPHGAQVRVEALDVDAGGATESHFRWVVASAVPKGERADWMVEKLSELGAAAFVPLAAERSVVLPEGKNKRERWARIATEAAKQSRRRGVMRVEPLTPLAEAVARAVAPGDGVRPGSGWFLSTADDTVPIRQAVDQVAEGRPPTLTLFIGPEGGWSPAELARFGQSGLTPVGLTRTILRVETAAVAAAAVVSAVLAPRLGAQAAPPVPPANDQEAS